MSQPPHIERLLPANQNTSDVARQTSAPQEDSELQKEQWSNTYGLTNISGNAQPILGNVYHTYNYFNKATDTLRKSRKRLQSTTGAARNLQVSTEQNTVTLDEISDYDPVWALWLRREQRIAQTCKWIFSVEEYKRWRSDPASPVLFCTVGCGKSITAGAVIDSFLSDAGPPISLVLSYFVDPARNSPTTALDVLRAFIKQLLVFHQTCHRQMPPSLLQKMQHTFSTNKAIPAIGMSTEIFLDLLAMTEMGCDIVIDGLDLLEERDVFEFLRFVRSCFVGDRNFQQRLKMIFFCRDTLGRGIRLEEVPSSAVLQISLEHVKLDIFKFVKNQVSTKQKERPITDNPDIISEIIEALKANSARMFLWVRLQVESIWDPNFPTNDSKIRNQLKSLPRNLDETYIQCLERIEETNIESSRDIAPKVFRWTALASRPLSAAEMQELISMDHNGQYFVTKDQILAFPVVDYCCNLVLHNRLTGCIEFAHPSVKDLLTDPTKVPESLRHFCLERSDGSACRRLCLKYVEHHRVTTQVVRYKQQQAVTGVSTPILRAVSDAVLPLRLSRGLFGSRTKINKTPTHDLLPVLSSYQRPLSRIDTNIHQYICNNWLWHASNITREDVDYALFAELCLCHDSSIQPWAFGQTKDADHDKRLVAHAVISNNLPLLEVVIQHVRPEQFFNLLEQPCAGTTSSLVHVAAALGHARIVDYLLTIGHSYHADDQGRSPLAVAAELRHNEVVSILVAFRAPGISPREIDIRDSGRVVKTTWESKLEVCVAAGNIEATKLVLDTQTLECSAEQCIWFFSAAMFIACQKGHIELTKLLVEAGANPNLHFDSANVTFANDPRFRSFLNAPSPPYPGSTLKEAVRVEDAALFENLLSVGAKPHDPIHPGLREMINYLGGPGNISRPFVSTFARCYGRVPLLEEGVRLDVLDGGRSNPVLEAGSLPTR